MRVDSTLEAHAQLAEGGQPGMGTLDHPAMAAQSVIAFDALACNSVLDSSQLDVCMAAREVIALVGVQFFGATPGPATQPSNRRQCVNQLLEEHRVMPIGPCDAKHQRDALPVRDEVALAAELAPVRGLGPVCGPPGGWARWPRPC